MWRGCCACGKNAHSPQAGEDCLLARRIEKVQAECVQQSRRARAMPVRGGRAQRGEKGFHKRMDEFVCHQQIWVSVRDLVNGETFAGPHGAEQGAR